MADCECLPRCAFFHGRIAHTVPSVAEMLKQRLCLGDSSGCARHMVFKKLGREHVPQNLMPNQVDMARHLLAGG